MPQSQDTGRNPRAVSELVFVRGSGSVPPSSEFLTRVLVLVCFDRDVTFTRAQATDQDDQHSAIRCLLCDGDTNSVGQ